MPSFRIELYKGKELKDNYYPICLTVTHKGKVKRKTIASATEAQWDSKNFKVKPKGRRDFDEVNRDIDDKFDKYKKIYKDLLDSGYEWSPEDVFKEQLKTSAMFKENALAYIGTITKIFTKDNFRVKYDKILRYTKGNDFKLDDIDVRWISGFRHFCKTKERSNKGKDQFGHVIMGNSDNTINQAIKFIKMVCSYAGVENKALKKTKISFTEPLLEFPDKDDFKALQSLKLVEGTNRWHVMNLFSVQIYLRGMRIGDALQLEWSDIKDGRLDHESGKTGHEHDIEIPPVAMGILNKYKNTGRKYIFPFFKWEYDKNLSKEENAKNHNKKIKQATSVVNNNLRKLSQAIKIPRTITSHQARHMFAIWADEFLNGDIGMAQKLLGHSNRAMTEKYIKRLRHASDLDKAASTVLAGIG